MGQFTSILRRYLAPQRGRVALLALLVVSGIALQLVNPLVVRYFLDSVEAGRPLTQLLGAAASFITIALLRQGIHLWGAYVGEVVAWVATNALRVDLARHCLRLDMTFHKTHKPGELIERVDGDVNQLAQLFSRLFIQLTGNLLLMVGVIVILWLIDWRFGLALTLVAALGQTFIRLLNPRIIQRVQAVRQVEAELFGFLEERLSGTETIVSSGAIGYTMRQLYGLLRGRWLANRHTMRLEVWISTLPMSLFMFAYIAIFLLGSTLFRNGALTIGTLYVIFYYIDIIKSPLWDTLRQIEELQRATASINRINELFAERPTIYDGPGAFLRDGAISVAFDDVSFHYADDPASPVLKDINFVLDEGRVLGLLGRTGSGKSTLTKLLFRFYDPTAGAILLNGVDLRHATQGQIRSRIGMVTQSVQLFNASVRDNLTLFDDEVDDGRIVATLHELGLADWLAALPNGLDTRLDGDAGLSAGEAQLLAFARVFLADPGVVILDEASSRLDPATEQLIERAIDKLLRGRTAIIVAHRLGTVQRADEIMILDGGSIAEHGKRAALAADSASRFSQLLQAGMMEALA